MWHVVTLSRITIWLLRRRSDRPVIGGDLVICFSGVDVWIIRGLFSPRSSWLRGINSGVQSVIIGIHSAWRKASDRTLWRRIVDMATLHQGARLWRERYLVKHSTNLLTQRVARSLCDSWASCPVYKHTRRRRCWKPTTQCHKSRDSIDLLETLRLQRCSN